jgi:hypothetical protein
MHELIVRLAKGEAVSLTIERPTEGHLITMVWSSPEVGLWVAMGDGEYAGMIEFADGHFVARGRTGEIIDTFSSIPVAKSAVVARAAA